jgi:hypothetical protein
MAFLIDFEFAGFIHFNQNRKVGEESNGNEKENEKEKQMRFI